MKVSSFPFSQSMDLEATFITKYKDASHFWLHSYWYTMQWVTDFPGGSDSKESACNSGDPRLSHMSGISPGEGNGIPFQYTCLENFMDRGAWSATVHGVTKSRTQLKWLSMQGVVIYPCVPQTTGHFQYSRPWFFFRHFYSHSVMYMFICWVI